MASIWSLGGVDIYVSDYSSEGDVKISEHVVLDAESSSVYHYFGSAAEKVSIQGHVFTETDRNSLESKRDGGDTVALVSDQGSEGNYKILSAEFNRLQSCKIVVPGVAEDTTAYRANIRLSKT